MSRNNYPKRFETLQNDGEILKFRVDELAKGKKEYFVKHSVNDKDQGKATKIHVPETLEYTVTESGKYTFSFYEYDPENKRQIKSNRSIWERGSFVLIMNKFQKIKDWLIKPNLPIWEQDILVLKPDPNGLSKGRISELALAYAPFVFLDTDERYLPASIAYVLNKNEETGEVIDKNLNVRVKLKFRHTELGGKILKRRTFFTGVRRKKISMHYNDLAEVLPYNGDNISVLDTIGINPFRLLTGHNKRTALENRFGDPSDVTLYYSYFPNPAKSQFVINYHFLYTYDSKKEAKGKLKKTSHVFDRESISVVFTWDKANPNKKIRPEYIIYGAHLKGQKMGAVRKDKSPLQKWASGRVKVKWSDVYKIKDQHPIVAVAQGSHAPYPVPGNYAVYIKEHVPALVESARTSKILIPPGHSYDNGLEDEFNKVYSYKLKDFELGNITSNSWNSILAFSGYVVDIIGLQNAKFPPYTERELDIDKWVNGDKEDKIHVWDTTKVEEETKEEIDKLIKKIESKLSGKKAVQKSFKRYDKDRRPTIKKDRKREQKVIVINKTRKVPK